MPLNIRKDIWKKGLKSCTHSTQTAQKENMERELYLLWIIGVNNSLVCGEHHHAELRRNDDHASSLFDLLKTKQLNNFST